CGARRRGAAPRLIASRGRALYVTGHVPPSSPNLRSRMSMAVAASAGNVPATHSLSGSGPVRSWLYCLAFLVIAMIAVGGATRLTGSGLSITEWKPVTGAIPPLGETAWLAEFEKYRQISQYELLNKGMTLSEFKFIYA